MSAYVAKMLAPLNTHGYIARRSAKNAIIVIYKIQLKNLYVFRVHVLALLRDIHSYWQ